MQAELTLCHSAAYLCEECRVTFCFLQCPADCPACGADKDNSTAVLIYGEDDPDRFLMLTRSDFNAGD